MQETEPRPTTALLLDMDGTLLDSGAMTSAAFEILEEKFHLNPGTLVAHYNAYRNLDSEGFSAAGLVAYLSNHIMEINDFDEFALQFNIAFGMAAMDNVYPDVAQLLHQLSLNKTHQVALFSQGERAWQLLKFANAFGDFAYGESPLFEEDMQFVSANKTDSEFLTHIQAVLRDRGVTHAIVVDDRAKTLQELQTNWPQGMGLTCIRIKRPTVQAYGSSPEDELQELSGVHVIDSLDQVQQTIDSAKE